MESNGWSYNMQNEYFNNMRQVKFAIIYLDLYADRADSIDTVIKMIIAVVSSASFATWAIWQRYPLLWSGLIAFANILTVINKYLPYSTDVKSIASFQIDLKLLYVDLEFNWFNIVKKNMKDEEINELLRDFKKQYAEIEKKIFKNRPSRPNPKLKKEAEDQTNEYYKIFFKGGI